MKKIRIVNQRKIKDANALHPKSLRSRKKVEIVSLSSFGSYETQEGRFSASTEEVYENNGEYVLAKLILNNINDGKDVEYKRTHAEETLNSLCRNR